MELDPPSSGMASSALPAGITLGDGERLLGQWDFSLRMTGSPVAQILTRFLLTTERLIVLQLPTPRVASGLASRLSLRGASTTFRDEMRKWHVRLDSKLRDLPEPAVGRVEFGHPTALPSDRALILGTQNFAVGEDPAAEAMAAKMRGQWAAVQALRSEAHE
jgi:hypothetical protein